jgi:hypothetical protein
MIDGTPPPDDRWREAPLLGAVTAHRARHEGETIGCGDEACRKRVDAAIKAVFERLLETDRRPGSRLFR